MKLTLFGMLRLFALALVSLAIIGCATPEARIKKNPELFNSFPLESQELIRKGEIAIAFTPEMVEMALGEPNRIYSRKTSEGTTDVWSYTATSTKTDRQRVNANFRYRDSKGSYRTASDWVWVDVARETEYERIRVEFSEGLVSAIDTLER